MASSDSEEQDKEDEKIKSVCKEQDEDKSELEQESEKTDSISEEEDEYIVDISNSLHKSSDTTIKTIYETNVRAELEKGKCIRNQLELWKNLLEMRIKLQKCVVLGNQMPQYDTHKELRSHVDFIKKMSESKAKLMLLVNNMLELRDLLLKQHPETRNLCASAKKRKANDEKDTSDSMDEEIPSNAEDELENEKKPSVNKDMEAAKKSGSRKRLRYNEYEKVLQENHDFYKEYRNSVIKKWNDKTRISTSSLNKSSGQSTLKQIEFAMSDIGKLRKRTQLKRSEYNIVGKSSSIENNDGRRVQEYDSEIYDDNDFYHQLLKDLIEYKSSDVTDPIQLSKQIIRLQNMRTKMKRKIDTRATKGRRVRYNIHTKLVNFMAPIAVYNIWTDNAKNELYTSLFDKTKLIKEQIIDL